MKLDLMTVVGHRCPQRAANTACDPDFRRAEDSDSLLQHRVTQSVILAYRRLAICTRVERAFTLMEVMIACGIFFMATFAILALVSTTLRNARGLQRGDIDAGLAAAQVYEVLKTNRLEQGSMSGDFGDAHRDYSWEANWDIDYDSGATNSLLKVEIVVNRRGNRQPVDALSIRVFSPNARSGFGPNFR